MNIAALIVSILAIIISGTDFLWNYLRSKTSLKIKCTKQKLNIDDMYLIKVELTNKSRFNYGIIEINFLKNNTTIPSKIISLSSCSFHTGEIHNIYADLKQFQLLAQTRHTKDIYIKKDDFVDDIKVEIKTPERTFISKILN